jgi:hypothetical protein
MTIAMPPVPNSLSEHAHEYRKLYNLFAEFASTPDPIGRWEDESDRKHLIKQRVTLFESIVGQLNKRIGVSGSATTLLEALNALTPQDSHADVQVARTLRSDIGRRGNACFSAIDLAVTKAINEAKENGMGNVPGWLTRCEERLDAAHQQLASYRGRA